MLSVDSVALTHMEIEDYEPSPNPLSLRRRAVEDPGPCPDETGIILLVSVPVRVPNFIRVSHVPVEPVPLGGFMTT